jgi:hypothetical protein
MARPILLGLVHPSKWKGNSNESNGTVIALAKGCNNRPFLNMVYDLKNP